MMVPERLLSLRTLLIFPSTWHLFLLTLKTIFSPLPLLSGTLLTYERSVNALVEMCFRCLLFFSYLLSFVRVSHRIIGHLSHITSRYNLNSTSVLVIAIRRRLS